MVERAQRGAQLAVDRVRQIEGWPLKLLQSAREIELGTRRLDDRRLAAARSDERDQGVGAEVTALAGDEARQRDERGEGDDS